MEPRLLLQIQVDMALLITVDLFMQILGGKVEAMVKWAYKQLPEPATVVMTNLSVGECTGIHESPVQMNLVIQVGYWSHTVSVGRRLACRYGAVCGGASSQYCSLAQLCTCCHSWQPFGWKDIHP